MITWNDFERTVLATIGRDIRRAANAPQHDAIKAPGTSSLFIVAGPGTGKTTVIVLRILKLIFVDGVDPQGILATTFTRRAAAELRSRLLGWGDQIRRALISHQNYKAIAPNLRRIDFNQIRTGTLDSTAEDLLGEHRAPGAGPPVVIEDFVANALMLREGLFSHGRHRSSDLTNYVARLAGNSFGLNPASISSMLLEIRDRILHDQVNIARYRRTSRDPGTPVACDAIDTYSQELNNSLVYDFSALEVAFLDRLRDGTMNPFLESLKYVLIDEYQDTNLLQEQIYFELGRSALSHKGSVSVVGDDDQSLYRFRGATVDLFQAFPNRVNATLHITPPTIYLSHNYRSTTNTVNFVNGFVTLDAAYQNARVAQKPVLHPARLNARGMPYINYPILGMFRPTVADLANDLARFIHTVCHGGGFPLPNQTALAPILVSAQGGSPADIAVLCSSPSEYSSNGQPRLPFLLRQRLGVMRPSTAVFNPRGQNLEEIPLVRTLCGLVLECIDPTATVQNSINRLPQETGAIFNAWRLQANAFVRNAPPPNRPTSLNKFVQAWQNRTPLQRRLQARTEINLNDLVYKLVTWLPLMQNDIEYIVYLEAITRTISQSAIFGNFGGDLIFEPGQVPLSAIAQASVREALWNIFVPLANGAIEINEDLLETLPKNRINIMSVHQAKGLEFPLVIVDVGSDFKTNHHTQAFKRFPSNPGKACNLEDEFRAHSPLGRPTRRGLDRAFDDLLRLYFVAFSRAKDALLLVGLSSATNRIENIATGWDRNRTWHWGNGLPNLVHI